MNTNRYRIALQAIAIAALTSLSIHAASVSAGNFTVNSSGNETGDLTVQGQAHFLQDLDFGTTASSFSAGLLHYSENGTTYTISLSATRPAASFRWQDNGVGVLSSKMLLGSDNSLSLFNATGTANIILNPTSGLITLAGTSPGIRFSDGTTLSSARASSLYSLSGNASATVTADAKVNFPNGITLGTSNVSTGTNAFASGANATATGTAATAHGTFTTASGNNTIALGTSTLASGVNAIAAGNSSTANGTTATAFGEGTIAQSYDSFVLGRFNLAQGNSTSWVATDDLFTIGIGANATSRANALVVKKSGDVTATKNLTISGTTTLTGATTIAGTATLNGATTIAGTTTHNGLTTFSKNITFSGNATNSVISGNLTFSGNTTTLSANTTATTGNATFAKNVAITGNTTLNGTLTLADGKVLANAASLRTSTLYTSSGNVAVSVGANGQVQFANGLTLSDGTALTNASSLRQSALYDSLGNAAATVSADGTLNATNGLNVGSNPNTKLDANKMGFLQNTIESMGYLPATSYSGDAAAIFGGNCAVVKTVCDSTGNIYTVGTYDRCLMLAGTTYSSDNNGNDIFICKFDSALTVQWINRYGGAGTDTVVDLSVDASGSVYVAGKFSGSANFGGTVLTSVSTQAAYVLKLNGDGTLLWARDFAQLQAGATPLLFSGPFLSAYSSGTESFVYVGTSFNGNVNFNGTTMTASGGRDCFIAKIDGTTGFAQWRKQYGGNSNDFFCSMAVDSAGSLIASGAYQGAATVEGVNLTNAGNLFLLKLNSNGTAAWVHQQGSSISGVWAYSIAIDVAGNAYVFGTFTNSASFGGFTLADATYTQQTFIEKVNPAGSVLWAKNYGSDQRVTAQALAIDSVGNINALGAFSGNGSFDGLQVTQNIELTNQEWFLLKVDGNGTQLGLSQLHCDTSTGLKSLTLAPYDRGIVSGSTQDTNLRLGSISVQGSFLYSWRAATPWVAVKKSGVRSSFQAGNGYVENSRGVALDGGISTGYGSFASGSGSKAISQGSTALGSGTVSAGFSSFTAGQSTVALGSYSSALGYRSTATGNSASALGEGTIAQAYGSLAIGRYNVAQGNSTTWIPTDDLFVLGNGNATTPSNAFVVRKNGDTTINGKLEVTGHSKLKIEPQGDLSMGAFTAE